MFSLKFLDSLLLLIWYILVATVSVATFVTVFPTPGEWLKTLVKPELLTIAVAVTFFAISAIRLAHNYGFPFYTAPACYAFSVIAFKAAVASAWLRDPEDPRQFWLIVVFPAFLLVAAVIVGRHMWARVTTRTRAMWNEFKPRRLRMMDRRLTKIAALKE